MRSPGINGEGELRGQPANRGSPEKWPLKMECVKNGVCISEIHTTVPVPKWYKLL